MPVAEGGGIFVSYRRDESSDAAGRLYDRLVEHFTKEQVFIDVDAIEPGVDFAEEISRAVAACKVLLVVIGPDWLTATGGRGGRRLDDPDDFVRLEIEAALARGVRVIPILVQGAAMPGRDDLPGSLAGLARRQAFRIRHESFRADAGRLVKVIEGVLAAAPGNAVVPVAQASLVTAWSESRIVVAGKQKRPVVVHNASELPVHDVQTWLYLPGKYPNEQLQMGDPPKRLNSTKRATIESGRRFRRNISVSGGGMDAPPKVGVKFRDANGDLWWRDFKGGLHHLRDDRTV